MAANNNNNNDEPVQPEDNLFDVQDGFELNRADMVFERSPYGLSVRLGDIGNVESIWVNDHGDRIFMCLPENPYAKKIAALMVQDMRERKIAFLQQANQNDDDEDPDAAAADARRQIARIGEFDSFRNVIHAEGIELCAEMGLTAPAYTDRRDTAMWRIMCGFNRHEIGNPQLDKVLLNYAKIRLGVTPRAGDELLAAMTAVEIYYDTVIKDSRKRNRGRVVGENYWSVPIVFMLNEHMKNNNLTPLSISNELAGDRRAARQRRVHSRQVWIQGNPVHVETRDAVCDELRAYVQRVHNETIPANVDVDAGPPDGADRPPNRRQRRSLHPFE